MKAKLAEYIDVIFADAERKSPDNRRLAELKEEMLQNLNDKYDDLLAGGRSPAAAYNIAVSSIGDVSPLLDSVTAGTAGAAGGQKPPKEPTAPPKAPTPPKRRPLTPEEEARMEQYRSRSAVMTALAIALYILCVVPCIIIGGDVVGPVLMFLMIAAATAMLIFNSMSKPKFVRDADGDDDDDDDDNDDDGDDRAETGRPARSPAYKAISGALWCVTVCVYLLVSFLTGYWHITWMLFLIAAAVDNIVKAIFDLRR